LKALIIDEKKHIADILLRDAARLGVEIHSAATLEEGLLVCQVDGEGFDVVLMRDMVSGHASCFAIQDFRSTPLSPEILIFTEQGNPQHAEHALEGGAWDYVVDPYPEKKLPDMLRRVLRYRHAKSNSFEESQREIREQLQGHGIIGSSIAIKNCL
jgi:two-component system NtrC family response regulator